MAEWVKKSDYIFFFTRNLFKVEIDGLKVKRWKMGEIRSTNWQLKDYNGDVEYSMGDIEVL